MATIEAESEQHWEAGINPSEDLAAAKARLESLQADQNTDQAANTVESMRGLLEVEKARDQVQRLEQREPFKGMSERDVAMALETSLVALDEARAALVSAEGPGQTARAERLISEAEQVVPNLQLELKRRQDDQANTAALARFADRTARAARPSQVTEIEEAIRAEQQKMNSAYAAGQAWEFGQMRRLQAGRDALLERIRTNADPTADELERVKGSWSNINPSGASFVVS